MSSRDILLCTIMVWCCASFSNAAPQYPRIDPVDRLINVPSVKNANVNVIIKSTGGRPEYKIECHSASYNEDPDFNYSGDFECRMTGVGGDSTYSTLFTEDEHQSRDWESRARFFSADLMGECARIPEFGSKRDFDLRGLKVTLQVLDPTFDRNGTIESLKLKITVQPNPSAYRPIASTVPLPASSPAQCKINKYFVGSSVSPKQ